MRRSLKVQLERVCWWFIHRFVKEHQYHLIRPTTLDPGFHEIPDRALHGMFQLVEEYINCFTCCDKEKHREIVKLYDWWKNRQYYRDRWTRLHWKAVGDFVNGCESQSTWFGVMKTPVRGSVEYDKYQKMIWEIHEQNAAWDEEDAKKLVEVSALMKYMIT